MFLINILAQIIIAGEGPGACMGSFALPTLGIISAYTTYRLLPKRKDK